MRSALLSFTYSCQTKLHCVKSSSKEPITHLLRFYHTPQFPHSTPIRLLIFRRTKWFVTVKNILKGFKIVVRFCLCYVILSRVPQSGAATEKAFRVHSSQLHFLGSQIPHQIMINCILKLSVK